MGLALYREFRPKTFDELIGQNHIKKTLSNQVKNNNTTHAYLFTGARGTGKTSCARILSKAINCKNPINGSPCGECDVCQALNEVNTDIVEMDAASNNRVDEIRDLREMVKYPPIIGRKKVYIIDEVHMLTESAFNALLKTLEEPPDYVVFILGTTEVHKIPATILSRCTRFDFKLFSNDELVLLLKKVLNARGIAYDEDSLKVIAKQAEGSARDCLSIADSVLSYSENKIQYEKTLEVLGLSKTKIITNIVEAIGNSNLSNLFQSIEVALNNGKNITILCKELTEYFKNLLLIESGITDTSVLNILPNELEDYQTTIKYFDVATLKLAFEKFSRIELDLKYSLNPKNLFEAVCVSLMKNNNEQNISINKENSEKIKKNTININENKENNNENLNKINEITLKNTEIIKKNDNISIKEENNFSINKIWGETLSIVRQKNMYAFSASLKNIYGVELNLNNLILHTNDKVVFDAVNVDEKKQILISILKELGVEINSIEVIYDENNKSKQDVVNNLKNIFMDKIKIKQ